MFWRDRLWCQRIKHVADHSEIWPEESEDTEVGCHQRHGPREREGGVRDVGGGLVIEGEREEQGERAVRRLQRLDSQVDCIWHKAQRWKKSGQLAHCTQHTPCSSTHLTMLLATPPPCPPPQTPSTSLPVFVLVLPLFTLSWGLLMGVSSTFPPGMFSPCPAGLAGPSEEQWSRV